MVAISQDLDAAFRIKDSLAQVLPGFETRGVDRQRPYLQARFKLGAHAAFSVDFRELSDGQRALIQRGVHARRIRLVDQALAAAGMPPRGAAERIS